MRLVLHLGLLLLGAVQGEPPRHSRRGGSLTRLRSSHPRSTADKDIPLDEIIRANLSTGGDTNGQHSAQMWVGYPAQSVRVSIDPYSSNFWVNPNCNVSACPTQCFEGGYYSPDASISGLSADEPGSWSIDYLYGWAEGYFHEDLVQFLGFSIELMTFGIAEDSALLTYGVLGMGFAGNDSSDNKAFLDEMTADGLEYGHKFSMYLGDQDDDGEILINGLNLGKFSGCMQKAPQVSAPPSFNRTSGPYLAYDSIGFSDLEECTVYKKWSPVPYPALLDFNNPVTYLPGDDVEALAHQFDDASYNSTSKSWMVGCQHRHHEGTIDFGFKDLYIRVPLKQFILQKDQKCYLGALNVTSNLPAVLGSNFLSAAYVVFDRDDDRSIWMAQYSSCAYHVVEWKPSAASSLAGECQNTLLPGMNGNRCSPASNHTIHVSTRQPHPTHHSTTNTRIVPSQPLTSHHHHSRKTSSSHRRTHTSRFPSSEPFRNTPPRPSWQTVSSSISESTWHIGTITPEPQSCTTDTTADCTSLPWTNMSTISWHSFTTRASHNATAAQTVTTTVFNPWETVHITTTEFVTRCPTPTTLTTPRSTSTPTRSRHAKPTVTSTVRATCQCPDLPVPTATTVVVTSTVTDFLMTIDFTSTVTVTEFFYSTPPSRNATATSSSSSPPAKSSGAMRP
ncbi:aspartic peptidase domain-containing protein [Xylariaceae sp. FL0016]|nr:aspartic peptidase domain-containing protein [Xylariaceae sp. FL0016]